MNLEINSEDAMLLAVIIEDLGMEMESRDESWIIQQQNPDLWPLTSSFLGRIRPVWLSRACSFFARKFVRSNTEKETKRIITVLSIGVEEELLKVESRNGVRFFTVTDAGSKWAENNYGELGQTELCDEDRIKRLIGASRLCRILLDRGSNMSDAELQSAVYPELDWDTVVHKGLRAQQQSYNSNTGDLFKRAVETAIGEGWVLKIEGECHLTSIGRDKGAVYFDNWR